MAVAAWRKENEKAAKRGQIVFGSRGPVNIEHTGADKQGNPTEDYGSEDEWDASSFKKHIEIEK